MPKLLLRILAFLIDTIIIYFPVIIILQVIFGIDFKLADVIAQLFLVIYFAVSGSAFNGKTIGKFFSKQHAIYMNGINDLTVVGLREFPKMLYFIPHFGFLFMLASLIMYVWKNNTIHDLIGGSMVLMDGEEKVRM